MIERQILWYKSSQSKNQFAEEGEERHFFNFLIVNTPDKIALIKQKIYDAVQPILVDKEISADKIEDSKLSYDLFFLMSSRNNEINFSGVYRGKVVLDRRLQPRKTIEGWDGLVKKVSQGEI